MCCLNFPKAKPMEANSSNTNCNPPNNNVSSCSNSSSGGKQWVRWEIVGNTRGTVLLLVTKCHA